MPAERRRRWSDTYRGVPDSDDEADGQPGGRVNGHGDPKLRREEAELAKIETGIAQVRRIGSTFSRRRNERPETSRRE